MPVTFDPEVIEKLYRCRHILKAHVVLDIL